MTTAMRSAVAAPIAKIFAINDDIVSKALEGLTDEQLWTRLMPRNNPMLWIVGHFVETRTQLMALLGEPFDTGWGQHFVRGATLRDAKQYPSREEIQDVMKDVSRRLHAKLATLDDEQMSRPPAVPLFGAETVADQVAGFALHDCYHVGQIGYIRKGLGYPALAG
jgi:hypothetical protein